MLKPRAWRDLQIKKKVGPTEQASEQERERKGRRIRSPFFRDQGKAAPTQFLKIILGPRWHSPEHISKHTKVLVLEHEWTFSTRLDIRETRMLVTHISGKPFKSTIGNNKYKEFGLEIIMKKIKLIVFDNARCMNNVKHIKKRTWNIPYMIYEFDHCTLITRCLHNIDEVALYFRCAIFNLHLVFKVNFHLPI